MNIGSDVINQVLNKVPYPIGKDQLVQAIKQQGAPDMLTSKLDQLPDTTFNNAQDAQNAIGKLGLGNLGNLGKQ